MIDDDEKIVEAMQESAGRHLPILRTLERDATRKAFKAAFVVARHYFFQQALAKAMDDAPLQWPAHAKFKYGDMVRKKSGAEWSGRVVGWYSTEDTPLGYAVLSDAHRGSVQIYPEAALQLKDA